MTDFAPTDAAEVERELAELRHRIDESLNAIADLAAIQSQFAELADTHRQYREALADLGSMTAIPSEDGGALRAQEQRLAAVERELGSVALHVGDDISQQVALLRTEFEGRLGTLEHQADERSQAVEKLERTIRDRLETWLSSQSSSEVTEELVDKVQRLASEFVLTRTSHRRLKRQVRHLRVGSIVGGVVLILLTGYQMWFLF
ncbi:MAG: hypothetical protein AAFX40_11050, partial [Cyanobacteria bacterium J06639_1]